MPRIATTLTTIALLGLAVSSCGKSASRKRQEVKNCSAISFDAAGIAACLVAQFRWDPADAKVAGIARQHEVDSIAAFQRDSLWRVDDAKHHQELTLCVGRGGDIARCLEDNYAWDDRRASATFDSIWQRNATKHRESIRACERQRKVNMTSCLMLSYQWDSKHALAVQDSLAREKIKSLQR